MINKIIEKLLRWPLTKLYMLKKIPGVGNLLLMAIGALIMSVGISAFLLNTSTNLVIGVGGLSRIIEVHMAGGETAGWLRTILRLENHSNISFVMYWVLSTAILLVGALKQKEKEGFVLKSFAGVVLVSLCILPILSHFGLNSWSWPFPEGISWIAFPVNAIIGAILLSLGIAITMGGGGSTCGPDLFAVLVGEKARSVLREKEDRVKAEKIEGFLMASTMRVFDIVVLVLGVYAFRPENPILYVTSVGLTIVILSTLVVAIDKVGRDILSKQESGKTEQNESAEESLGKPEIQVALAPAIPEKLSDVGIGSRIFEGLLDESTRESNSENAHKLVALWIRAKNGVLSQVSTYENEQIVFRYQSDENTNA